MMFPPDLYFDILSWWINESGHPGFCNLPLPENCPSPIFVDNEESENNIDTEVDGKVEEKFEGGQYFFRLHKIHQKKHPSIKQEKDLQLHL